MAVIAGGGDLPSGAPFIGNSVYECSRIGYTRRRKPLGGRHGRTRRRSRRPHQRSRARGDGGALAAEPADRDRSQRQGRRTARLEPGDGQDAALAPRRQEGRLDRARRAPLPLYPDDRAHRLRRQRVPPPGRPPVRRARGAAAGPPGRGRSAQRRGYRRDRTPDPGAQAMTAWLTDTLLYTGLLIALVLLVRRLFSHYFGPQFAYALWALPALRLLLPPVELPADMGPQQAQLSDQALLALAMATSTSPVAAPAPSPLWQRTDLWLALWLGSAALFLAWRIVSYLRMRRELLAEARPVGEVGRIRLVETPAVSSPVAFGVRDKVVALPQFFMAMPDRGARDLAIAHELEHHRGHDIAANFAAEPLLALHWFNPLAWIGWRAMRRDQEAACDARVLAGRDREARAAYAGLIAGFAAGPRLALAAPLACPMSGGLWGEKSIIHRLRSLSMSDVSPSRRRLGRWLLAGGALALPLTASVSYAAAAQDGPLQPVDVAPSDAPPASPVPPVPPVPPGAIQAPLPPAAPDAPKVEKR